MDSKNFWMLPAVLPVALAISSSASAETPAHKADFRNHQLRTPKVATYDLSVMDDATPEVALSRKQAWLRGTKGVPVVRGNRQGVRGSSGVDTLDRIDYSFITGTMAGGVDEIASDASFRANISSDGAFSVFTSFAQNLTADDALGFAQIYRVNNTTGAIEMVSKTTANGPGNGGSGVPTFKGNSMFHASMFRNGISNDGARVSFTSEADNLVAGDTNGVSDVFVWDSTGPTVSRVSVTSAGAQLTGASFDGMISGNGNFVAFTSLDAIGNTAGFTADPDVAFADSLVGRQIGANIFRRDISGAATTLVSHAFGAAGTGANSDSFAASISDDGTRIAYESRSLNLISPAKTSIANTGNVNAQNLCSIYMWSSGSGANEMVDRDEAAGDVNANALDSWGAYISRNGRFVIYITRKALDATTGGGSRVECTDMNAASWWLTHRRMNTNAAGTNLIATGGYRMGWSGWISDDGLVATFTNKPISADGLQDWDEVRVKVVATDTSNVSLTDPPMINTAVGGATVDTGEYRWGSGHDKGAPSAAVMSADKTKFVFTHNSTVLDGPTAGLPNVFLGTVNGSMTVTGMTRISRGTTNGGTIALGEDSVTKVSSFQKPAISSNGKYVVYSSINPTPLEAIPFASRPYQIGHNFAGVNGEQMYVVDTETGDWALASFGVATDTSIYALGVGDPISTYGNLYTFSDGSDFVSTSGLYPIQDFAAMQNSEVTWTDSFYGPGFNRSQFEELGFAASVSNNGDVCFWTPGYTDAPDGPNAVFGTLLGQYYIMVTNAAAGTCEALLTNGGGYIANTVSHIVPFSEATHISADGRYVGFTSDAIDVVLPDDNGGVSRQAYIHDRNAVSNPNRLVARRRDTGTGLGVTTEITGGESFTLGISSDGQKVLWTDVDAGNIFDPSFAPDSIGQLFLFNDAASGAFNDGVGTMQCVSTDDAGAAVTDSAGTPFTGSYSSTAMSSDGAVVAFLGSLDTTTVTGESGPAVGLQAYKKVVGANSGTGVLGDLTILSKASGAPFVDGTDGINTLSMSTDGTQIAFPSDVAAGFSTNPATDTNGAQWDVFRIDVTGVTIESTHPTNGQTDVGTSLPASVSQRGTTTRTVFNSDADTVFNAGSCSVNNHLWLHTRSVAAADSGSWIMYE
jgi:hypothetical protein